MGPDQPASNLDNFSSSICPDKHVSLVYEKHLFVRAVAQKPNTPKTIDRRCSGHCGNASSVVGDCWCINVNSLLCRQLYTAIVRVVSTVELRMIAGRSRPWHVYNSAGNQAGVQTRLSNFAEMDFPTIRLSNGKCITFYYLNEN